MSNKGYEVGYGKPPVEHRFKKGQSGNRHGRQREHRNLKTLFLEEASATITVKQGGRQRKITKGEALMKRLWADALSGKARAMAQLIQLMNRLEADTYESPEDQARELNYYVRLMHASTLGMTIEEFEESESRRWRQAPVLSPPDETEPES